MGQEPRVIVHGDRSAAAAAEVTLPGAQIGLEARITNTELRSIRFLVAIAAVTVLVLGLISGLGFQLLRHLLRGEGVGSGPECTEGDNTCAEGQVCELGFCREGLDAAHKCQVGDACNSLCVSGPDLRCGPDAVYVAARQGSQEVCRDARVAEFLEAIARKCVSIKSCKGEDFKDFAIGRGDFIDLMTTFPGTMALHFPSGKPSIEAGAEAWPNEAVKAHYVERLRPMVPALRGAQTILLVALSSRGEPSKRSDARAFRRAQLAEEMVLAAARQASLDAAALDALEAKLKSVQLGDRKQISPKMYAGQMLARSITWSRDTDDDLRSLLERNDLPPRQSQYRNALVNQTVFVVPIPCSLAAGGP